MRRSLALTRSAKRSSDSATISRDGANDVLLALRLLEGGHPAIKVFEGESHGLKVLLIRRFGNLPRYELKSSK